jgi:hypothetical protein
MFEECQLVNAIYGDVAAQITEREEQLKLEYGNSQALWEAVRTGDDKDQRRSAVLARNKAQAALWEFEQDTEQNLKERLNQTTSLLDQERRRNQALKGA